MNAESRKAISTMISQLEDIRAKAEDMGNEEQGKYDNMPDNLQQSERGEAMQDAANALEEAAQSIQDAMDRLSEVS